MLLSGCLAGLSDPVVNLPLSLPSQFLFLNARARSARAG